MVKRFGRQTRAAFQYDAIGRIGIVIGIECTPCSKVRLEAIGRHCSLNTIVSATEDTAEITTEQILVGSILEILPSVVCVCGGLMVPMLGSLNR